jgi:AAA+ ATPase superfamily predicted ATPase
MTRGTMLFDTRPKIRREDLYGRETELNELLDAMKSETPLIILLGQRRIGKTSLLKTGLENIEQPSIYLDMRRLEEEGYSKVVLYRILSDEMTRLNSTWGKLGEVLKRVKGVEVAGSGIELDWSEKGSLLSSIFGSLEDWSKKQRTKKRARNDLLVAIDEAQLLNKLKGGKGKIDFPNLIAYCYDNLPHVKFILTGSEVGLLMDFIGSESSKSPLYGRGKEEITLTRFSQEKSFGYLIEGFKQCKLKIKEDTLEKVVGSLDGIVGWLTLYGNYRMRRKNAKETEIMHSVLDAAKDTARNELQSILARSKYYGLALKSMANGRTQWSEIKSDLSSWIKRPITDSQVTRTLSTLRKLDIVEKHGDNYSINDPIVSEFAKEL